MFGLVIVLIATLAIAFASFRLGSGVCAEGDVDVDRNTSLVVLALGIMFMLCGVLASMSGSWNPFNAITAPRSTVII